jgi:hypothetical protein
MKDYCGKDLQARFISVVDTTASSNLGSGSGEGPEHGVKSLLQLCVTPLKRKMARVLADGWEVGSTSAFWFTSAGIFARMFDGELLLCWW